MLPWNDVDGENPYGEWMRANTKRKSESVRKKSQATPQSCQEDGDAGVSMDPTWTKNNPTRNGNNVEGNLVNPEMPTSFALVVFDQDFSEVEFNVRESALNARETDIEHSLVYVSHFLWLRQFPCFWGRTHILTFGFRIITRSGETSVSEQPE